MYCDVADKGIHVCQLLSYFEKIAHMSVFLAYISLYLLAYVSLWLCKVEGTVS